MQVLAKQPLGFISFDEEGNRLDFAFIASGLPEEVPLWVQTDKFFGEVVELGIVEIQSK
jgi:hypothetical protein